MPTTYKRVFHVYCFNGDEDKVVDFQRIEYDDLPEVIGSIYSKYDNCHVSIYPEFIKNE